MRPLDLKEGKLYVMDMSPFTVPPDLRSWDKIVFDQYHGTVVIYLGIDVGGVAEDFTAVDELLITSNGFRRFLWQEKVIALTEESIRKNLVTPEQFKKKHYTGS